MSETETVIAVVEEEKPKMVLAPLPTKSPWEETSSTAVKPLDLSKAVAAKNKRVGAMGKSRSKGTPSLTGKEKWVPLDVDIVVKDKIPEVGAKSKKLKTKSKKDKPKTKSKPKAKDSKPKKELETQKQSKKHERLPKNKNDEVTENGMKTETSPSLNNDEHGVDHAEPGSEDEAQEKKQDKAQQPHRRFTPNSKPFFPKNMTNNANGQSHQSHHHTNNHSHHSHSAKNQRPRSHGPMMYQPNYTPSFVLVKEIVRQIQYYFSIDNLTKDMFLRSQMNSQGYVPLALISRFHRMLNLSYGDVGLILAAMRELNTSPESNVNIAKLTTPFENVTGNPLFQYALSSKVWTYEPKQEPSNFETTEFNGDELELFKIEPITPIIRSAPATATHVVQQAPEESNNITTDQ